LPSPDAAQELDVKVPQADAAPRCLADAGERLDEQVVDGGAVLQPTAKLDGLGLEIVVTQRLDLLFQGVDHLAEAAILLQQTLVPASENSCEDRHIRSFRRSRPGYPRPRATADRLRASAKPVILRSSLGARNRSRASPDGLALDVL
jgi:hypothetical protein